MHPDKCWQVSAAELQVLIGQGLLTKAEARAIVLDCYPSAKRISEAQKIVDEASA